MVINMLRKLTSILLAAISLLSFTACWDHLEISKMLIIAGIGLDVDDSGKKYHATVECVNVEAEGDKNISAKIVEGDGDTAYNAIQNAMVFTGGVMFTNHCKVVVIGDKLARKGVNDVVEMILRSADFRKTVDLLIAKDATAESVIKKKTVNNDIISYELSKILKSNADSINNTVAAGVYQFHESLISGCSYFVVPTVYAKENNGEDALQIDGCAVFGGEYMRGFLDGTQCKYFNLITNNAKSATISVDTPLSAQAKIDVKIAQSSASLRPYLQNGEPSVLVDITVQATLEDAVLSELNPADAQAVGQIQNSINVQLSAGVKKLVSDVQSRYGTDIFGFHSEFEDRYRREWPGLEQDWSSRFSSMEVSVVPDAHITGSGLVSNYAPKSTDRHNANALP